MARNKNKNKQKGSGGNIQTNNEKKHVTSIAAGEFEGDAVSSGSQSRSLGWGTFTPTAGDYDDSERESNSQRSNRSSLAGDGAAVVAVSKEMAPEKAVVKAAPSTPDTAASLTPPSKETAIKESGNPFSSSPPSKEKDSSKSNEGKAVDTAMVAAGGAALSKTSTEKDDKAVTSPKDDGNNKPVLAPGAAVVTGAAIAGGAIVASKGRSLVPTGAGSSTRTDGAMVPSKGQNVAVAGQDGGAMVPRKGQDLPAVDDGTSAAGAMVPSKGQDLAAVDGNTSAAGATVPGKGQDLAAVDSGSGAVVKGSEAVPYLGTVSTPTRGGTDASNMIDKTAVAVTGASALAQAPGVFKGPNTLSKKDLTEDAEGSPPDPSRDNTEALANPKHAEEERARKAALMVAGGTGAAALVMSRGGGDVAPVDAGNESDASSQPNNNYLPTDLATTNKTLDNSPRELQGPVPVGDGGAIEAVSRDLKITEVPKGTAVPGAENEQEEDQNSEDSNDRARGVFIFWLIFCCCLIIAAVILGVLLSRDDDDSDDPSGDNIGRGDIDLDFTLGPTAVPTPTPTIAPTTIAPTTTTSTTITPTTFAPTLAPVVPLNPTIQLPGGITDVLFGSSLAFSGDGQVLAVGNLDGWGVYDSASEDLTAWTPRTGAATRKLRATAATRRLRALQANNGGSLVGLTGDGGTVAVADQGGARVRMYTWDEAEWTLIGNEVSNFTLSNNVQSLGFSGGGMTVAVGGEGAVQALHFFPGPNRWFPRGNLLLGTSSLGEHVALSQDGTRLITTTSATGELTAYEWKDPENVWEVSGAPIPGAGAPIEALVMDASGLVIAYGSQGSVYGYRFVGGVWVQLGSTITGTEPSFGSALAMDSSASLLMIGANESDEFAEDAGEVRFYSFDNSSNEWVMVYDTVYGMQAGDRVGTSVSVSADGRVLAVSADQRDLPETGYVGIYQRAV
eukprot:scaffold5588_cov180-Amphora_coffeaeformis.AAC.2